VSSERGGDSAPADEENDLALRVVLCNAPPEHAEAIARTVLEKRLAACVNIVPNVVSLYWWGGELCREEESTLLIKTRRDLIAALTEVIRAAHPYEVPEVIALPLAPGEGNAAYRAWLVAETAAEKR
jgi:periplasmic divalent cation tolerance protein